MSDPFLPGAPDEPPALRYQAIDAVAAAQNKMRDAKDALRRAINAMDHAAFLPFEYDYAIGMLTRTLNNVHDAKALMQSASIADVGGPEGEPITDPRVCDLIDEERGIARPAKGGDA